MIVNCQECMYWKHTISNLGECRYWPPLPTGQSERPQIVSGPPAARWRETLNTDWCGHSASRGEVYDPTA